METPVQIVFQEVAHSQAIESLIRDKAGAHPATGRTGSHEGA
ncbi:MAG: hypothetical protein ABI728_05375 [Betaproteobacteria bacterium]